MGRSVSITELESLVVRLIADTKQYKKELDQATAELKRHTAKMEAELERTNNTISAKMEKLGGSMKSFGAKMSLFVTTPLSIMGGMSVHAFGAFDDAMTKSTAIMSGVTADMRKQMEDVAKSISADSITAPRELAESYYYLASAGMDAMSSMKALPIVEKFAVAGAFDMAQATDLLTDAQSALGLASKDPIENMKNMTALSDVLVKANTLANASVEQFSKALTTKSAAALRLLNKDMEEGVAVLAAFADQGVKGELAGERLAIVLRDLQTASLRNKEAWEQMKISVYDANGKMLPMADIIEQMEKKLKGMSDEQKKATFTMLGFTDRSVNAIQSLMGTSEKIREYEKALRAAGGTTEQVSEKQLKSFNSQMKMLRNNVTLAMMEVGDALAPALVKLNEIIRGMIDWWRGLSSGVKQFTVWTAVVVAAIGPLNTAMGILIGMLSALVGWITVPIAGFAALGAAIAGLVVYIVGPGSLSDAWDYAITSIKNFFAAAYGFLANFRTNMKILFEWLPDNWHLVWADMLKVVFTFGANFVNNMMVSLKIMYRLLIAFEGWIAGVFERVFSLDMLKWIWEGIKKAGKAFKEFAKYAWEYLKSIFTGKDVSMTDLVEQMQQDFNKGRSNLNFLSTARDIIREETKNIRSPLEGFESSIKEGPKFVLDTGKEAKKFVKDFNVNVEKNMKEFKPVEPPKVMDTKKVTEDFKEVKKQHQQVKSEIENQPIQIKAIGVSKIESALADTVEAKARIENYLALRSVEPTGIGADTMTGESKATSPIGGEKDKVEQLLEQLVDYTRQELEKPAVVLEGAEL